MHTYEILYEYIYIIKIKILCNFKIYQVSKNILFYKIDTYTLILIFKRKILLYLKKIKI